MSNKKVYTFRDDMTKKESLTKEEIENVIEKNSGVPVGGIIDFEGTDIPEGFEKITEEQKILWSDNGNYMGANQQAQLSEKISEQKNGIVLVFTEWDSVKNERRGWGYNTFFVPKTIIPITWNGVGMSFQMFWQNTFRAFKYLYIYDNCIVGNENNIATQNGVNNCGQVLIAVIGV